MAITRKVKIEYFRVNFRSSKDTRDQLFDLRRWVDKANSFSLEHRVCDYYQEQARLDKGFFVPEYDLWYLNFLRLRDHIVPSKATLKEEAEPLTLGDDEYIGEDIVALYDAENYILAFQRNRFSIDPTGLEKYLNDIWHRFEENKDEIIYLRPIPGKDAYDRAKNKDIYRKLTMRFADVQSLNPDYNDNSSLNRLLNELSGGFKALSAEVIVSIGRVRNDTLDPETVRDSLEQLSKNKRFMSKVELTALDIEDTKVEVIDLFDNKIFDIATFYLKGREVLSSSMIANEMNRLYWEKLKNEIVDIFSSERRDLK